MNDINDVTRKKIRARYGFWPFFKLPQQKSNLDNISNSYLYGSIILVSRLLNLSMFSWSKNGLKHTNKR